MATDGSMALLRPHRQPRPKLARRCKRGNWLVEKRQLVSREPGVEAVVRQLRVHQAPDEGGRKWMVKRPREVISATSLDQT